MPVYSKPVKKLFILFLFLTAHFSAFTKGDTLYVNGRHIYSAAGEKIVLRGVNEMFVWSGDKTGSWTLDEIAQTGANCVRLVWDTNGDPGSLASLINRCVSRKMIAMPECHSATGNWGNLNLCVDMWKNKTIIEAVQRNKKWCMVNIANEAGNSSVTASQFISGYSRAIDSLRKWGYTVPLVIDASTWGQNVDILIETWDTLINHDPLKNIVFSAHSYWSSTANYTKVAEASKNLNMPLIIGEGPSPTAYPNCYRLGFETGLEVCGKNEIGWLAWSWGMMSNGHCVPKFDLTSNGQFGNWETPEAEIMVFRHEYSLMKTAEKPASFYPNSIVPVEGVLLASNMINIARGDSAKLEVVVAPKNTLDKSYQLVLLTGKDKVKLSADSTHLIGIKEGTAIVKAIHVKSGVSSKLTFTVSTPLTSTEIKTPVNCASIFPNPANDQIFIKFEKPTLYSANILNPEGKVVFTIYETQKTTIPIKKFEPGFYVLQIQTSENLQSFKFLKQ